MTHTTGSTLHARNRYRKLIADGADCFALADAVIQDAFTEDGRATRESLRAVLVSVLSVQHERVVSLGLENRSAVEALETLQADRKALSDLVTEQREDLGRTMTQVANVLTTQRQEWTDAVTEVVGSVVGAIDRLVTVSRERSNEVGMAIVGAIHRLADSRPPVAAKRTAKPRKAVGAGTPKGKARRRSK